MKFYKFLLLGLALSCTETEETKTDTIDEDEEEQKEEPEDLPYGPDNEWPHALTSEVVQPDSCGTSVNDVACNFTMKDQNGDEVELYQFSGKVVVLDLFAEW